MTKEEAKKLVLTVRMALAALEDDTCVAAIEAKAEILKLVAQPVQPVQERNFCPRCGKRTADLAAIHTCTPPQENT